MSIDNFFTMQNILPNASSTSIGVPVQRSDGEIASELAKLNFVDLIMARIQDNLAADENALEIQDAQDIQNAQNAISADDVAGLDFAKILAANPEIAQEVEDFAAATGLGPDAALIQTLTLNQKAFDDALKPLSGGIIMSAEIAKGSPRLMQALLIEDEISEDAYVNNLNMMQIKIQKMIEDDAEALTLTNLSPQDLSLLQNITSEDVGDIAIQNPALGDALENIIHLVESHDLNGAIDNGTTQIADDPVLQNALALLFAPLKQAVGMNTGDGVAPPPPLKTNLTPLNPQAPLAGIGEYEGNLQAGLRSDLQGQMKHSGKGGEDALLQAAKSAAGKDGASNILAPLPALMAANGDAAGSLTFSQSVLEAYTLNANATTAMHAAANVSAQASSTATAHPATQLLAVTMQKLSSSGQNKTIALQLDPPELGRVEVRMEFGKDKTMRAVLVADKPETFLMMQRDAHHLERSLQDMGLDTDGGLSFELAEQGFDFDQNNQRGGGHDKGGTGGGAGEGEDEIIETSMTWQIDPVSGQTRYDILA